MVIVKSGAIAPASRHNELELPMRIGLLLLSAPIGYAVLTGYLLLKIRPLPIALLPESFVAEEEAIPVPLAA